MNKSTTRFAWCRVEIESSSTMLIALHRGRKVSTVSKARKGDSQDSSSNLDASTKQCELCLKPLGKVHGNRKFCSDYCRNRADRVRDYGLTAEEYRTLIGDGKCCICGRKMRRPHIDHDHETGEVYGAICAWCNERVLGHFGHGVRGVQRALALVQYMENPPAVQLLGKVVKVKDGFK